MPERAVSSKDIFLHVLLAQLGSAGLCCAVLRTARISVRCAPTEPI